MDQWISGLPYRESWHSWETNLEMAVLVSTVVGDLVRMSSVNMVATWLL